ncbi:MAG: hypothetical protein ABL977_05100 [Candidatus Eisenbacteria bacterium]
MDRSARHLHHLVRALVSPWVLALPIAAVLGTLSDLGWLGYQIGYRVALFFCYPIMLCVWFTNAFIVPRLSVVRSGHARLWLREILPTAASALVGAMIGMAGMELRVAGSIGDANSVAQVLMFTFLFVVLVLAGLHSLPARRRTVRGESDTFELARRLHADLVDRMRFERPGAHPHGSR